MSAEDPYCSFLSMFQSNDPSRSGCFMPKKELDATKCEVMRYYKLLTKGNVVPISFTVPRKVSPMGQLQWICVVQGTI